MNRLCRTIFILVMVGIMLPSGAVVAAGAKVAVVPDQPTVPGDDMAKLVSEAMKQARNGDYELAYSLCNRSDQALPYLDRYSLEADDSIRYRVEEIASQSHSPHALHLLSNLLAHHDSQSDVSSLVIKDIATCYTRREIRWWGGKKLRMAAMHMAYSSPANSHAILFLASFGTTEARTVIADIRHRTLPTEETVVDGAFLKTKLHFIADLALAETGDRKALQRLRQQMKDKHIQDRVALAHTLMFFENKNVLLLVPSYLHDKRIARERTVFVMTDKGCFGRKLSPLRVCDFAARALDSKVANDWWRGTDEDGPLSKREIASSRQRFARWLRWN